MNGHPIQAADIVAPIVLGGGAIIVFPSTPSASFSSSS